MITDYNYTVNSVSVKRHVIVEVKNLDPSLTLLDDGSPCGAQLVPFFISLHFI